MSDKTKERGGPKATRISVGRNDERSAVSADEYARINDLLGRGYTMHHLLLLGVEKAIDIDRGLE